MSEGEGSPAESSDRVYSVSELTREIKMTLENGFPPIWVEGEISNFKRHSSGHCYFSLNDSGAQISCVLWRGRSLSLRFEPEDGMKVLLFGSLAVYEKQGRYQLDVQRLQPAGIGELQVAFEALKRRLEAEGLFDTARKRMLPEFPNAVGVVTSPTGAAIRDIVSVLGRRFPSVRIILRPVRVQGEGAAEEIAEAIGDFNRYGGVDVLIVGRGGGSIEDLWAFNEEIVARAIYSSEIPVVSAVGHEIDFSISDFVADRRAPTPSAAAEMVVKDRSELLQMLSVWVRRAVRLQQNRLSLYKERIESIRSRYGFRWPMNRLRECRMMLDEAQQDLSAGFERLLSDRKMKIQTLSGQLNALSPLAVLDRGYSITTRARDGKVLRESTDVQESEAVTIRLSRGTLHGKVEQIEKP